jgi:copper homeostasis protein CutC
LRAFAWRDDKAQTGEFLPEIDVVQVAADGQIAIATDTDKTLDQLLDIATFPIIILGGGDFLERDRADASGALRLEQAGIAQIG